jgi:hypothetical protein
VRAQRARLEDVDAAADPAVQQDCDPVSDCRRNCRQGFEGGSRTVELAPAVVRHHYAIAADRHRPLRVVGPLHAF